MLKCNWIFIIHVGIVGVFCVKRPFYNYKNKNKNKNSALSKYIEIHWKLLFSAH